MENNESQKDYLTFGYYSAFLLSFLTIVAFGFAMTAIPPAGPYCPDNCMEYPFPDILLYYPRDYYWMYIAIFQLFAFVIFIVTIHFTANVAKKLFTFLSVSFALISSTVLLMAYFTQFSVVPISVMKGETDGIALITQYNEHGLFIAMEELGYITMSIALFFLAFAFSKNTRTEKIIRIILISQLFATILAFIFYSIKFGIERSYLFEVATITINWSVLIFVGILTGLHYRKRLKMHTI
ncbi:MAG: hypothetical protein KG029_10155 [Bacteroidetes bacterium]|nr:hypothetical protein [Bacteroidota bacterium]